MKFDKLLGYMAENEDLISNDEKMYLNDLYKLMEQRKLKNTEEYAGYQELMDLTISLKEDKLKWIYLRKMLNSYLSEKGLKNSHLSIDDFKDMFTRDINKNRELIYIVETGMSKNKKLCR